VCAADRALEVTEGTVILLAAARRRPQRGLGARRRRGQVARGVIGSHGMLGRRQRQREAAHERHQRQPGSNARAGTIHHFYCSALFLLTRPGFGNTVLLYYVSSTVAMLIRPNPSSGVPIYLQVMEQVKHGIETGALRPGDQLPGIRPLAEELVINPNTVAKAYRELEHEGVIELRHGAGAFVKATAGARKVTDRLRAGQTIVAGAMEKLRARGLGEDEIRRLFEAELSASRKTGVHGG
jgi:GntR family transcriptional regulator